MSAKLTQAEVARACEAAYQQFVGVPPAMAALAFSYMLQGFAKYMVKDCDSSLPEVRRRVIELLDLLDEANSDEKNI
jgi:hypothetical protein